MIPKRIFSIWLNEDASLPELVQRCLATHKLDGYEHNFITLDNCQRGIRYVEEAIGARRWVKAVDYLRMYYIHKYGGFYFDLDVEIKGKIDHLLDNGLLVCKEDNDYFSNAVVGSEEKHSLLTEYLRRLDQNFRGDGDLVFEPGMRAFGDLIWIADKQAQRIRVLSSDYFFPYNKQKQTMNVTNNTIGIHHFNNSWINK